MACYKLIDMPIEVSNNIGRYYSKSMFMDRYIKVMDYENKIVNERINKLINKAKDKKMEEEFGNTSNEISFKGESVIVNQICKLETGLEDLKNAVEDLRVRFRSVLDEETPGKEISFTDKKDGNSVVFDRLAKLCIATTDIRSNIQDITNRCEL